MLDLYSRRVKPGLNTASLKKNRQQPGIKGKRSFLDSFPEDEWWLNGHPKDRSSLFLFKSFAPYIREGRYLELGCGSGILCKFLCLFSGKRIVPYGVDINANAIRLARKNNPKFRKNFFLADYFRLNQKFFFGFSTIMIFMEQQKDPRENLRRLLRKISSQNRKSSIVVVFYDGIFSYGRAAVTPGPSLIKRMLPGKAARKNQIHFLFPLGSQKAGVKVLDGILLKKTKTTLRVRPHGRAARFAVKVWLSPETIFAEMPISLRQSNIRMAKADRLMEGDSLSIVLCPNRKHPAAWVVRKVF